MDKAKGKTLGQRIRELREQQDLALRELAKKLAVSPAFLSDIELGRRFPSEVKLARLAELLGTTTDDLMKYDTRAPLEDIKRLAGSDSVYGFALRRAVKQGISGEELLELLKKKLEKDKEK